MMRLGKLLQPCLSGAVTRSTTYDCSLLWLRGVCNSPALQAAAPGAGGPSTSSQHETSGTDEGQFAEEDEEGTSYDTGPEAQRSLAQQIARQSLAAEVSAAAFFRTQAKCSPSGPRLDLDYFRDQELQLLQRAKASLVHNKARPSALQGLFGAAGLALGTLAGLAPRRINLAITGALQDAMTDHFTDQMRRLHASGGGEESSEVRELLRGLRDAERAPDGAPRAPDVVALSQMRSVSDLGVEGAVGAVVKAGALAALSLAAKL